MMAYVHWGYKRFALAYSSFCRNKRKTVVVYSNIQAFIQLIKSTGMWWNCFSVTHFTNEFFLLIKVALYYERRLTIGLYTEFTFPPWSTNRAAQERDKNEYNKSRRGEADKDEVRGTSLGGGGSSCPVIALSVFSKGKYESEDAKANTFQTI
jgi:hypothetical protein